jgi:hypothetical protein
LGDISEKENKKIRKGKEGQSRVEERALVPRLGFDVIY